MTVRVAAFVVAGLPTPLLNTAWYWLPFIAVLTAVRVSVVLLAPAMGFQVAPSVETSHCTLGVGVPEAVALKVAVKAWDGSGMGLVDGLWLQNGNGHGFAGAVAVLVLLLSPWESFMFCRFGVLPARESCRTLSVLPMR